MEVVINGEPRQVPPAINLQDLLRLLELKEDRVAVELNRGIVQRHRWPETLLRDQDRLEVVQFVGGG
jgi:thiamine biosynthesis protein ThiS